MRIMAIMTVCVCRNSCVLHIKLDIFHIGIQTKQIWRQRLTQGTEFPELLTNDTIKGLYQNVLSQLLIQMTHRNVIAPAFTLKRPQMVESGDHEAPPTQLACSQSVAEC